MGLLYLYFDHSMIMGFPGGSDGKESTCNAGDLGSIPGLRRSPGEGNGSHSSILVWKIPRTEEPGRRLLCEVGEKKKMLRKRMYSYLKGNILYICKQDGKEKENQLLKSLVNLVYFLYST